MDGTGQGRDCCDRFTKTVNTNDELPVEVIKRDLSGLCPPPLDFRMNESEIAGTSTSPPVPLPVSRD